MDPNAQQPAATPTPPGNYPVQPANAPGQAQPAYVQATPGPQPAPMMAASQPATPNAQQSKTPPVKRNPNSTQNSLLFAEMREGMVIMNDGSFRAVISCQSINFDLMSAREREGVEYSYQSFLNSLYFPIQMFIRSSKVDIGPYLNHLAKIRRDQDNMLLGVLMDDYMDFIDALSRETNIMDKRFYVVVPYYPGGDAASIVQNSKSIFTTFLNPEKEKTVTIDANSYAKAKDEISNRVNAVMSGLFQMGIKCSQLNTQQLAELYYNMYNPDEAVYQPLGDINSMATTYVRKGQGQAPQPNLDNGAAQ